MKVKGIVHCHTNLSYDSEVELEELCRVVKREGFNFIAFTEHNKGLSSDIYREYVGRCRILSDEFFLAIPGLEICCSDGTEIAALGTVRFRRVGYLRKGVCQSSCSGRIRHLGPPAQENETLPPMAWLGRHRGVEHKSGWRSCT